MKTTNNHLIIKAFLTIALITIVLHSSAQPYRPVLRTDSTSWDVSYQDMPGVMKVRLYAKKQPSAIYVNLYQVGEPYSGYKGKVREDSTNGKMWFQNQYIFPERLIMDMSLNIGESFQLDPWV